MADYHEQLMKAGALLDAVGLQPSSQGWRIKYSGEDRRVIDGPFTEAKELIAGYTIIQVNRGRKRSHGPSGFLTRKEKARRPRSKYVR